MEIDMGEVDLVFGFCVYYTKNPEQRWAQQLVFNNNNFNKIIFIKQYLITKGHLNGLVSFFVSLNLSIAIIFI
jgi:hypothetical protein